MREIKYEIIFSDMSKDVYTFEDLARGDFSYNHIDGVSTLIAIREYIGLKDKNGIEIYEGDLLRWHSDNRESVCTQAKAAFYL